MAVLGVSSLAPALPAMSRSLHLSPESVGALITIFTLPGILFSPLAGMLADKVGRKPVLLSALFLFTLSGAACFWVRDFNLLLGLRFLQGTGAASIGVLSLTLIGDFYSGSRQTSIMGLNASVLSMGTALYPLIGGLMSGIAWNYPFLLCFLGIPVIGLVIWRLPPAHSRHRGSWHVYIRESLSAIHDRTVILLLVLMVAMFILIYGICLTAFPFMMDHMRSSSPLMIGLFLTLMSSGTLFASWHLKEVSGFLGKRGTVAAGFFLYIAGCFLLPRVGGTWLLAGVCLMIGAANGMNVPALHVLISEISPPAHRGVFMSLASTMIRVGQTLGPFLFGVFYRQVTLPELFTMGSFLAFGMMLLTAGLPVFPAELHEGS